MAESAQHPAPAPSGDEQTALTPDDFPLGKACDLSGETDCEACQ